MEKPIPIEELQKRIKDLEAEVQARGIELEANEGLLKLAMQDMRRIYEDLLRSQSQLMQSDKLATIGLLTAGIVHEINNPLSAVRLAFSLLESQTELIKKKHPDEKQWLLDSKEYLSQGSRCVDTIVRIVGDIRVFSRTDKGLMNEESVEKIVESVIGIVWNSLKNRVTIQKDFAVLPKIVCNAQQLSQVFLNLIVNAAQAIGDKPGTIKISSSVEGPNVSVRVSDTGCGMPPEVMEKIFEPFFTTKGAEQGTGLGLSITHDIVKKHGGEILVESKPGLGTTFTVLLPVKTA